MKVACLIESISRRAGGLSEAELQLQSAVVRQDPSLDVRVFGVRDDFSDADAPRWEPVRTQVLDSIGPRHLCYAPRLKHELERLDPDFVYCAGLWKFMSWTCLAWSRSTGRPYAVTPHGMLDTWALRNHRWQKRLLGWLYQTAHSRGAACLRALNEAEACCFRKLGFDNPICIFPNGVAAADPRGNAIAPWCRESNGQADSRDVALYLGRLHPKKNLHALIEAWEIARRRQSSAMARWRLIVAGFGDAAYEAALKAQVRDGRLEHEVSFVGPVNGAEKTAAFAEAKAFVLPSLSEGMPVAALEAWSFGLPAILTTACNLPEGVRSGAAIETAPKTESLAEAIGQLAEMTDQERVAMGQRGRKLVESQFSWPRIADQCRQMYAWLAGGPKPECLWDR